MNQYIFRDFLIYSPDDFVQLKLNCQLIPRVNKGYINLLHNWPILLFFNEKTNQYMPFPLEKLKMSKAGPANIPLCMDMEGILKLAGYYNLPNLIDYYFSFLSPLNPHLPSEYDIDIGCFMATLSGATEGNHPLLFEYLLTLVPPDPKSQNEFKKDHFWDDPFHSAIKNENIQILKLLVKHDLLKSINLKMADRLIHENSNPELLYFYNEYIDPEPDWDATLNYSLKHQSLSLFYRSMTELSDTPLRPKTLFFLYAFCPLPQTKQNENPDKYLITPSTDRSRLDKLKSKYKEHEILKFYLPILLKVKTQFIGEDLPFENYWYECLKGVCYSGNIPGIKNLFNTSYSSPIKSKILSKIRPNVLVDAILSNPKIEDTKCWEVVETIFNLIIESALTLDFVYTRDDLIQSCLPNTCAYLRPYVLQKLISQLNGPVHEPNQSLTNLCDFYDSTIPNAKSKAQEIIQILKQNGATHCTDGRCKYIRRHSLKGLHQ